MVLFAGRENLDDFVHIFHRVIHNMEADAKRSETGGNLDIGSRWFEVSRGMVVDNDVTV
jgi:hypothetical protein